LIVDCGIGPNADWPDFGGPSIIIDSRKRIVPGKAVCGRSGGGESPEIGEFSGLPLQDEPKKGLLGGCSRFYVVVFHGETERCNLAKFQTMLLVLDQLKKAAIP
jgi:hypothetical protein